MEALMRAEVDESVNLSAEARQRNGSAAAGLSAEAPERFGGA